MIRAVIVYLSGAATLLCMYGFSRHPYLILLALAVIGVVMLVALRSARYALWYAVAFVLGPILLDLPGLHLGLWSYGAPQLFGFPYWLPFFYGNVTVSFIYFLLATQGRRARR